MADLENKVGSSGNPSDGQEGQYGPKEKKLPMAVHVIEDSRSRGHDIQIPSLGVTIPGYKQGDPEYKG